MQGFRIILSALCLGASIFYVSAGESNCHEGFLKAPEADSIRFANTIRIYPGDTPEVIVAKAAHVVPDARQLRAMDREFIAFVHFGPNTFSRREWGTGFENPADFTPSALDTDQWARIMAEAGMKMVILTVKHHDGFVIYQSRYTDHGIMSSPFMDGNGDVLRSLAESARKYGLKVGIYLSPADLYQIENEKGLYGNLSKKTRRTIPREVLGRPFADKRKFEFVVDDYNEYFLNQLYELLTEYGPIDEVWFDGAHPKRKGGQTYDYAAWMEVIHTLAPLAVVFGREDVRWCGNEAGRTRETEWNVVPLPGNPDTLSVFPDMTIEDVGSREKLAKGKWLHYQYPETDVSIRRGWFYRDEDQEVRDADDVFDIYERAVGGNCVLLLNIPPNREGRLDDRDVATLREVGRRIRETYGTNLLEGADIKQAILPGDIYPSTVIALPRPVTINRVSVGEPIATSSERVERHILQAFVDGKWTDIDTATNIGRKRIHRIGDITTDSLRIRVTEARLKPGPLSVTAHYYKAPAPADGVVSQREALDMKDWKRTEAKDGVVIIDLGSPLTFGTIGYLPPKDGKGALTRVRILLSKDGMNFHGVAAWDLGNLVNDPTERFLNLGEPQTTRYIRIEPVRTEDGNKASPAEIRLYP